jgi:hypothetical protein
LDYLPEDPEEQGSQQAQFWLEQERRREEQQQQEQQQERPAKRARVELQQQEQQQQQQQQQQGRWLVPVKVRAWPASFRATGHHLDCALHLRLA